ncbi:DUF1786 domain-containing protein [Thermovibrio sp.]
MEAVLVDVGKGTQDILIPIKGEAPENWIKAVLTSPTTKLAKRVREHRGKELKLCGYTMGGGPLKKAVIEFIKRGGRAFASPQAAKTFRDDLTQVKELGIEVVSEIEECDLCLRDLEFEVFKGLRALGGLKENFEFIGVACQDHGFIKGQSDRITRFNYLRELLGKSRRPWELYHTEETGFLSRFDSVLRQIKDEGLRGFVMDSKLAAVAGVYSYAKEEGVREFVCIDCGNGHTLVSTVRDGLICGFLEHHTRMLTPDKLKNFMVKLIAGRITFEEVYKDGGHGALFIESIKPEKVYLVGPNREKFKELGEYAYPLGDAMLFGCAGLLEALRGYGNEIFSPL